MRTTLLTLALTGIFAATLGAQDDAAFRDLMKKTEDNFLPLRKAPDNEAAKANAAGLADTMDKVAAWWKAKGAADAVAAADSARDTAKDIAAGKGDLDANRTKLIQACTGCHSVHRGGKTPDYTIK